MLIEESEKKKNRQLLEIEPRNQLRQLLGPWIKPTPWLEPPGVQLSIKIFQSVTNRVMTTHME